MSKSASSSRNDGTTLDRVFTSLSDPIRRRVLTVLARENPRTADEFHPADPQPGDETLERFRARLHHKHLPHLEDAGFIEWDRDSDTVTRGPNFEEVEPLITLMTDHEDDLPEDWP